MLIGVQLLCFFRSDLSCQGQEFGNPGFVMFHPLIKHRHREDDEREALNDNVQPPVARSAFEFFDAGDSSSKSRMTAISALSPIQDANSHGVNRVRGKEMPITRPKSGQGQNHCDESTLRSSFGSFQVTASLVCASQDEHAIFRIWLAESCSRMRSFGSKSLPHNQRPYLSRKNTEPLTGSMGFVTVLPLVESGTLNQLVLNPAANELVCACSIQPI